MHIADQNIMQNGNPIKLNFEGLERQRCYIPMDTAQRVDNKNGIICLFTFLLQELWLSKCQKWIFFVFSVDGSISHSLGKIIKCIRKILVSFFRSRYGSFGSELSLARCRPLKIKDFSILFTQQSF